MVVVHLIWSDESERLVRIDGKFSDSRMMDAWTEWKNTEVQRIFREGNDKWLRAAEVGNRLSEHVPRQGNRAVEVANRLHADGHMIARPDMTCIPRSKGLKRDMWDYVTTAKSNNMSASHEIKSDAMNEVYGKATSKWSEYYAKEKG